MGNELMLFSMANQTVNFPPLGAHKRPRTDSPPAEGNEFNFNKYMLVQLEEGSFQEMSPFLVNKLITGFCAVENIKKLRDGTLLVTVPTKQISEKFLSCKKLGEHNVKVSVHSFLNLSKGVIYNRDLLYSTDDEIIENLADQGVVDVKRLTRKVDKVDKPTGSFILTFNRFKLPEKVKAAYHSLEVRPFVPNPLRCFKCQKFGHISNTCKDRPICALCGIEEHGETVECTKPPKCPNCGGEHAPRSRECPVFKVEFAVQKIKVEEKISYLEAKKKFFSLSPNNIFSLGKSFSSATAQPKKMCTTGTQCSLGTDTINQRKLDRMAQQPKPSVAPGPKPVPTKPSVSKPAPKTKHLKPGNKEKSAPGQSTHLSSARSSSCEEDCIADELMDEDPSVFIQVSNRKSKPNLKR